MPGNDAGILMIKNKFLFLAYFIAFTDGFYSAMYQFTLFDITSSLKVGSAVFGSMMGILVAVQFFSSIIPPLIFGRIADKIGKKPVILFGYSVWIAGLLIMGLSANFAMVLVSSLLLGMGFSLVVSNVSAAIADEAIIDSTKQLNRSLVFFSLGGGVAPVVSTVLYRLGLDWKSLYILVAIVCLVYCIALVRIKLKVPHKKAVDRPARGIARQSVFLLAAACFLIYGGLETGSGSFADALCLQIFPGTGISPIALTAFWLGMVPARAIAGFAGLSRFKIVYISISIAVIAFIAIAFSTVGWLTVAMFALSGFGLGALWPTLAGIFSSAYPQNSGMVMSAAIAAGGVSSMMIPLIMGYFKDATGNFSSSYIVLFIFAVFLFIVFKQLDRSCKKKI